MMTLKMRQIVASEQALSRLLQKELAKKTAYSLRRLSKMAGAELEQWHKHHNEALTEHGTKDDKGGVSVTPGTPGFAAFMAAMTEYGDVDVELAWDKIEYESLGENLPISAMDLDVLLGVFVTDPDTKAVEPKTEDPSPETPVSA